MQRDEIEALVDECGGKLYGFCKKLAGIEADDLYQETFVKLTETIHKVDANKNPSSYLFSVAIYIWKSKRRKWARRQSLAPTLDMDDAAMQADSADLESDFVSKEIRLMVNNEVSKLHDKYRIPVYLFYTSGMTMEEIAAVMHIPVGTVKSRLHKARKLLKQRLEAAGYEGY